MSRVRAVQPMLGKVGVGPAIMGYAPPVVVVLAMTLEPISPRATSNQTIQAAEHARVGRVFEVVKPGP